MKQAIAGVAPTDGVEVTVMSVWPSVAGMRFLGFPMGRYLGQLYGIKAGIYVLTIGNLFCLLSIPLALILYFKRIGPFVAQRYRITNKRVVVDMGLSGREGKGIDLDRFDTIQVETHPGDTWFQAGDLVFKQKDIERFRLEGVSRPEVFRQTCLKSRQAFVGVKQALAS